MRLLKTRSHTSNGLAMEPGKREEKQLKKETQALYNKANHPSKTCRVPPVWRGGGGRKGYTANKPQKRHYGKQTFVERKGNTGANTREKSRQKPPADHWNGGRSTRKRQIPGMEGDTTYSPARGRSV